jgi:hypothetical protein
MRWRRRRERVQAPAEPEQSRPVPLHRSGADCVLDTGAHLALRLRMPRRLVAAVLFAAACSTTVASPPGSSGAGAGASSGGSGPGSSSSSSAAASSTGTTGTAGSTGSGTPDAGPVDLAAQVDGFCTPFAAW